MHGVYLIDPDGMSGMLEDGTEFVWKEQDLKAVLSRSLSWCSGCIGKDMNADRALLELAGENDAPCASLPMCSSRRTGKFVDGIFIVKEK